MSSAKCILAWEAKLVLPGIRKQHRVGELGADAQVGGFQDDVRHLGKAGGGNGIKAIEDDVLDSDQPTASLMLLHCTTV